MASPWAQVKNQAQTAEPRDMSSVWASMQPDQAPPVQTPKTQAVWYTPDNGMEPKNKIDLHQNLPDVFPPAPEPRVVQDQDPLAQEQGHLTNKLNRDYAKDVPYDWSQHSLGGKIGHVMAKIGNVAGEALAPGVMARIPETELGRRVQEQQLAKQVQDITGAQSENAYRGTETAKNTAEQPFIAPKAQAGVRLQNAQAENLENPPDKWMNIPGELTPTGQPIAFDPKTATYQAGDISGLQPTRAGAGDKMQHVPGMVAGKPTFANYDPIKGNFTNPDTGEVIHGFTPQPQAAMLPPWMVSPEGVINRPKPGSVIAPGSMTPSQEGSLYQPTGQEKTAAGRANIVMKEFPNTIKSIRDNATELGPLMGRWDEFMQGKVGADNPKFAGLRTNLMMMATAVAMAHAVGRLPENLREEFDQAINAPHQSPENLVSVLTAIQPWMEDMSHMAQPGFNQGLNQQGGTNPPAANQPKVLKFNPTSGRLE